MDLLYRTLIIAGVVTTFLLILALFTGCVTLYGDGAYVKRTWWF